MSDPISRLPLARQEIDRAFGTGYAAAHPELVAVVMQSAASDRHRRMLEDNQRQIAEAEERMRAHEEREAAEARKAQEAGRPGSLLRGARLADRERMSAVDRVGHQAGRSARRSRRVMLVGCALRFRQLRTYVAYVGAAKCQKGP